jgi:hypothetical protein
MMPTREPWAPCMDGDASAVQGGTAYLTDIERRLAPYFERVKPRQRAMAYVWGLLSPAERKNSWQLEEGRPLMLAQPAEGYLDMDGLNKA